MSRPCILHVINRYHPGSGAFRRAREIDQDKFKVEIATYYKINEKYQRPELPREHEFFSLEAESRVDLPAWKRLYRALNSDIDLVHTHHHLAGYLVRTLNRLGPGKPVIHSFGNEFHGFSLPARLMHTVTLPLVDRLICVSRSVKDSLNGVVSGFIRNEPEVVRNGIDLDTIDSLEIDKDEIRAEWDLTGNEFLVGSVGHLTAQKDYGTLLKGIEKAIHKIDNLQLMIVGDGELRDEIENLVEQLNIESNVTFTGEIPREKVLKLLSVFDVYVMTSLWEGLCVAALEAMARGKPMILTDISPFQEAINDRESGLIIPKKDPTSLAEALVELRDNPSLRNNLGQNARQRVEEHFTLDQTAAQYERIYREELMDGSS